MRFVPRAHLPAAVALVAVGVALRLHGLADRPLWIDEYGTTWAIAGGWGETVERVLAIHGQSPLYYLLVQAVTEVLGPTPLGLRLVSLLAGVALLVFIHPLALRIFGDARVALATLAVAALCEPLIVDSGDGRPYALALLCAALSFWFFTALVRRGDDAGWRDRAGWALATLATLYTHYLFAAVALAQAAYWALRGPRLRARDWGVLVAVGLLALPGAAQLALIYSRRHVLDWIEAPEGPWAGLAVALEQLDPWMLAVVVASVALVWLVERPSAPALPDARPGIAVAWVAVPLVALGLLPPLLGVSLLEPRYLRMVVPGVVLLYGWALGWPRGRLGWLPFAVWLAAVSLLGLGPRLRDGDVPDFWYRAQHWDEAAESIARRHRPGEVILYATGFVELDALVQGEGRPALASFSAWPVRANLPADGDFDLRPLPYSDTPAARERVEAIVDDAAGARGVWVIGMGPMTAAAIAAANAHPGLSRLAHERHGFVDVARFLRVGG